MSTRISKEELSLFEKLHNKRLDALKVLSTRPFRGVWKNVIDQYPESAHFIYELLQNANDAKAYYARINITKEGVIFIHNGTIQFSITSSEGEEKENRKIGHINSITSIGDSSKDGLNTIGKFGIGFKSVFSYTDTPYIYDDKFWFRIDNYIVPILLDEDFEGRNEGETLFWLPFKSNDKERCYKEVAKKNTNTR